MNPVISCTGKKAFQSHALASAVVSRCNRNGDAARSVYRCGFCHLWHLGSDRGGTSRKRAADFRKKREVNHE